MNEKELLENQKRVVEIMNKMAKNPQEAAEQLLALQKDVEAVLSPDSQEYCISSMAVCEAYGDCMVRLKKVPDAEKSYQQMVNHAAKFFEFDREKNDYHLGAAYYKLGSFYRTLIGCNVLLPKPKEFTEPQKKVFEVAEQCYKSAIGCTMQNAKKGLLRYVEFHSVCLADLIVFHAAAGDYKTAILCGKDAVRLGKMVYEKKDDKAQAVRLANFMNALAAVYMFSKEPQPAMESLEDAVYVLEEHEKEDETGIGAMLARYYISLGSCYVAIEEEKHQAEEAYKKGLERMVAINDKTNNKMIDDVIQSYMFVADYYAKEQKEFDAKSHYTWAMKLASDMWKVTKNPKYDNLVKHLQSKV